MQTIYEYGLFVSLALMDGYRINEKICQASNTYYFQAIDP
jgi:hypothetical protein